MMNDALQKSINSNVRLLLDARERSDFDGELIAVARLQRNMQEADGTSVSVTVDFQEITILDMAKALLAFDDQRGDIDQHRCPRCGSAGYEPAEHEPTCPVRFASIIVERSGT